MKIGELPKEKPRVDLKTLPQEQPLIAISEEWKDAQQGKTAGLVITFRQKDGQEFKQKYSPMHTASMIKALEDLNLKDTMDLQKGWQNYKLVTFRMGFPRYIPYKKK